MFGNGGKARNWRYIPKEKAMAYSFVVFILERSQNGGGLKRWRTHTRLAGEMARETFAVYILAMCEFTLDSCLFTHDIRVLESMINWICISLFCSSHSMTVFPNSMQSIDRVESCIKDVPCQSRAVMILSIYMLLLYRHFISTFMKPCTYQVHVSFTLLLAPNRWPLTMDEW
jgi:hypothetical protein